MALSCYELLLEHLSRQRVELVDVAGTRQVLANWQGRGAGRPIVGPGALALTAPCMESAFVVAGAKEAEASPATATSRANMRMAAFNFGNLLVLECEEISSLME